MRGVIDEDDDVMQIFLKAAERVIERGGGKVTQMVFGTLWKRMYPHWRLADFVRSRFKHAPSIARILQGSERFVVTTVDSGKATFWLPHTFYKHNPPTGEHQQPVAAAR
jgi:hypothetical protein